VLWWLWYLALWIVVWPFALALATIVAIALGWRMRSQLARKAAEGDE
jgi:hypothetical protein